MSALPPRAGPSRRARPGHNPAEVAAKAPLDLLAEEVAACTACPRLVAWREHAAAHPPAAHAGEPYWARPVPGFGDPAARLVIVGLAPGAHGANRTGRMFTGDRSGDFLFAALERAGFANQASSTGRDDGLALDGAYVTAVVRCAPPANRPSPEERDRCVDFLRRELTLLPEWRVVLALGQFAFEALWRLPEIVPHQVVVPRPRFAHGLEVRLARKTRGAAAATLICSYHPSQRNVFTGRLDATMFDAILARARSLGA